MISLRRLWKRKFVFQGEALGALRYFGMTERIFFSNLFPADDFVIILVLLLLGIYLNYGQNRHVLVFERTYLLLCILLVGETGDNYHMAQM